MKKIEILNTIHGSRLYGMHHANSDWDTYSVWLGVPRPSLHKVEGQDDTVRVEFNRFLELCAKGVPQALEALWSPYAAIHHMYAPMLKGFRVDAVGAAHTHLRTLNAMADGSQKQRRHALRIARNTVSLLRVGSYNPAMTRETVDRIKWEADQIDAFPDILKTILARY